MRERRDSKCEVLIVSFQLEVLVSGQMNDSRTLIVSNGACLSGKFDNVITTSTDGNCTSSFHLKTKKNEIITCESEIEPLSRKFRKKTRSHTSNLCVQNSKLCHNIVLPNFRSCFNLPLVATPLSTFFHSFFLFGPLLSLRSAEFLFWCCFCFCSYFACPASGPEFCRTVTSTRVSKSCMTEKVALFLHM